MSLHDKVRTKPIFLELVLWKKAGEQVSGWAGGQEQRLFTYIPGQNPRISPMSTQEDSEG